MRAGDLARFAVIALGTLLGPLDSAVNIAFPNITGSFAIPIQSIQWVVISYVLTYASLMLIFGRLGDLFGHLRIFQAGLAISVIAFVLCATASQYEWLLVFRVVQGVGTAMVISCGPALVTSLFGEAARPRVLGAYVAVFGIGAAIGPSLGGVLVAQWGWPAVYWFRVPLALLALALSVGLPMRMAGRRRAAGGFDRLGAVLLVLALALLLATFSQLRNAALGLLLPGFLMLATVGAFAAFIWHERRVAAPIIQLGLFANPAFALFNATNIAVNFAGFSVLLLVPYFLVRAAGLPLSLGGVILASGAIGMIAAAQAGGYLTQRLGAGRVAATGAVLVALGIALIGLWPGNTPPAIMVATLLVHGVGLGLFQVSCLEAVTAVVPRIDRGVAGSLVMVTRTIGVVLAASLLSMAFAVLREQAVDAGAPDAFLAGFQAIFRYTAGFLAAYLAVAAIASRMWGRSRAATRP
jgi:MFS family permease